MCKVTSLHMDFDTFFTLISPPLPAPRPTVPFCSYCLRLRIS